MKLKLKLKDNKISRLKGWLTEMIAFLMLLCAATQVSSQHQCATAVDLELVVDGSASISARDWKTSSAFLTALVSAFTVGNQTARIGLVQFSSTASSRQELPLSGDQQKILSVISGMRQQKGGTDIGRGLRLAQGDLMARGRPLARANRVLILLTDGASNQGGSPLPAAEAAKGNGTTVFSVGVGPEVNKQMLAQICSQPPSSHLFSVADFDDLAEILHLLAFRSCVRVISIDPDHGPASGGTAVLLTGEGFYDGNIAVRFGGAASSKGLYGSESTVAARTPPGQPGASVSIEVSFDGGNSWVSAPQQVAFTYDAEAGCPDDCSGNGVCVGGQCLCNTPWVGRNCDTLSCPNSCSGHGSCNNGTCACFQGYSGNSCEHSECPSNCHGNGKCANGQCQCSAGYAPPYCESKEIVCCHYCYPPRKTVWRAECQVAVPFGPNNSSCSGYSVEKCILDGGNGKPRPCIRNYGYCKQ